MPNITETISLLDELRGKLNNGLIGDEFDDAVWEFVKAYNTTLRQAALDGERYRKAGEELVRAVQNISRNGAIQSLVATTAIAVPNGIGAALETYRQAVEQKEV